MRTPATANRKPTPQQGITAGANQKTLPQPVEKTNPQQGTPLFKKNQFLEVIDLPFLTRRYVLLVQQPIEYLLPLLYSHHDNL